MPSSVCRPRITSVPGLVLAMVWMATACSDRGVEPSAPATVSLSVAAGGSASSAVVIADGAHQLRIDRLAVVVGDITLGAAEVLDEGPSLVEAPLDGTVRSLVAAIVPAGRYDMLGLRLHAPDGDDPADDAFLLAHPGLEGVSVRLEGQWDGTPFVFERRLDEDRAIGLDGIELAPGRTTNLTLRLDPSSWFRGDDGALTDPRMAHTDPVVAARVESMIRGSMSAFADQDADGVADPR